MRPEAFLEYRIVRLGHLLQRRFDTALGKAGLTAREFSVLAVLAGEPDITAAALARLVLTTPQAMTGLLDKLERRELIERPDIRGRGKAVPLHLTATGWEVMTNASRIVAALDGETLAILGTSRAEMLSDVLTELERPFE